MNGKKVKIVNKNSPYYKLNGIQTRVNCGCMGDLHTVRFKDGAEVVFGDDEIYVLNPLKLFPLSIWRLAISKRDLRYASADDQYWVPLFPRALDEIFSGFGFYLMWRRG